VEVGIGTLPSIDASDELMISKRYSRESIMLAGRCSKVE